MIREGDLPMTSSGNMVGLFINGVAYMKSSRLQTRVVSHRLRLASLLSHLYHWLLKLPRPLPVKIVGGIQSPMRV